MVKKNISKKSVGAKANAKSNKKNQAQVKASSGKASSKKKKVSSSNKISSKKQLQDIASNSSLKATQSFYDDSIYANKVNGNKNKAKNTSSKQNQDSRINLDKTKISTRFKFMSTKDNDSRQVINNQNKNKNKNKNTFKSLQSNTTVQQKNSSSSFSSIKVLLSILLLGVAIFVGYKIVSDSLTVDRSVLDNLDRSNPSVIETEGLSSSQETESVLEDQTQTNSNSSIDEKPEQKIKTTKIKAHNKSTLQKEDGIKKVKSGSKSHKKGKSSSSKKTRKN